MSSVYGVTARKEWQESKEKELYPPMAYFSLLYHSLWASEANTDLPCISFSALKEIANINNEQLKQLCTRLKKKNHKLRHLSKPFASKFIQ